MEIKIDPKFQKRVEGMFGKYRFQVGILQDGPHKDARRGVRGKGGQDVLSTYAGGPIRKKSRDASSTLNEVSKNLRETSGVNYLVEPFRSKNKAQADIIKFSNAFFNLVFGRSQAKRAVNLLQAIVRNPILRGDYGSNSRVAQRIKGFNRWGIDTAQLFKGIKAQVKVRGAA